MSIYAIFQYHALETSEITSEELYLMIFFRGVRIFLCISRSPKTGDTFSVQIFAKWKMEGRNREEIDQLSPLICEHVRKTVLYMCDIYVGLTK